MPELALLGIGHLGIENIPYKCTTVVIPNPPAILFLISLERAQGAFLPCQIKLLIRDYMEWRYVCGKHIGSDLNT